MASAHSEDLEQASSDELLTTIQNCKEDMDGISMVLRGSITEHLVRCGKKGCRCQKTPPKLHGPYFDWTRKVQGKTRTVRLTRSHAAVCQQWIENGRQLNQIIAKWEQVGIDAVENLRQTKGES